MNSVNKDMFFKNIFFFNLKYKKVLGLIAQINKNDQYF